MDIKRGWKTLLTTEQLIDFARRHGVPLGRSNPRRTLNYYIRLGLLPPRLRSSDGRFRWGFPLHARAFLLRIRDLKREGLTLPKIREALEREIVPDYKVIKRLLETSPPTLGALPFNDPVWDYSYQYYQVQAQQALEALERGDIETAQRILKEMRELAEGIRQGKRYLIIIGDKARVEEM